MRQLTANEIRLSILLAGSLFIIANLFGISAYVRHTRAIKAEIATLKNQKTEAEVWMGDRTFWEAGGQWIEQHQPKRRAGIDASGDLLQAIQKSTAEHQLTIVRQSLQEPRETPAYYEVAVRLTLNGSFENLTRWLSDLQSPTAFYAIPSFTLKSDKEPSNIICDLTVARWLSPTAP